MIPVNEYFAGHVKSLTLNTPEGKKTVGVMAPGEYEFNTGQPERMTVICGKLTVLLSQSSAWQDFNAGAVFHVPAQSKFQLKVTQDTAYLCEFL